MKVLVAGDFAPIGKVRQLCVDGKYESFLSKVKTLTGKADYSIVNLEAPIEYGTHEPIAKQGPVLQSHPSAISALKWAGFDCITLANNHIMDLGPDAVGKTVWNCREAGLDTVGAGQNISEASQILYKESEGETLAVINCCEREFSIASKTTPGANPMEPVHIYNSIREAGQKADYTVVIVHGGIEHYQLPSPRMCELYRFFIEAGSDAVLNHHQHCFSGYEVHRGKPIFYGLGNFCFDLVGKKNEKWYEGYMVELELKAGKQHPSFRLIPYVQNKEKAGVFPHDSEIFNQMLEKLNSLISDEKMLEMEYESFLDANSKPYEYAVTPYFGRIGAGLYFHGLLPDIMPKGKLRMLLDYIVCDSHRDRLIHILEKLSR